MASIEHQVPSCSYNPVGTSGEPKKLPRVGKKYQAQLPRLLEDLDSYSYSSVDYADEEIRDDFLQSIHVGSPLKLAWISISRTSSGLKQSEANNIKKAQISLCEDALSSDLRTCMEESESLPRLVPEKCDGNWTAAEKDCFLLGLYIFAKNFVEVRKLVGTKDMGALQSYYYGTFYSSPEHHRWSKIRKIKHKKGALGRGIFYGQRLKEFQSRLLPRVGEYQNDLLEVSKSFENEKISLAEYVLSLKAMIGAGLLVEAVGIGKTHYDLTSSSFGARLRHNLQSEKAYASLTTAEILKLLNGEHKLSKARSNDLFWEAVWPCLLANGWHSEQYTSYKHVAGSTPNLVFVIPGVEKFSRRKLVKGYHYFDSLSDVLSQVARDPALINLNLEDVDDRSNEAEGHVGTNDENHSASSLMKFTVVDTGNGKVVNLRTLPSDSEISLKLPTKATSRGKKHACDDASNALVHKKTRKDVPESSQDQDQARRNDQDMLPSTTSRAEEARPQLLIDLNLPPASEDGSIAAEASHEQDITSNRVQIGEQSTSNPIRYSSRQRPPTTRVLEAFARGYLSVNRKRKRKDASTDEE